MEQLLLASQPQAIRLQTPLLVIPHLNQAETCYVRIDNSHTHNRLSTVLSLHRGVVHVTLMLVVSFYTHGSEFEIVHGSSGSQTSFRLGMAECTVWREASE